MALPKPSPYRDRKPPLLGRPRVPQIKQGRGQKEEEEGWRITRVLEGLARYIGLGHSRRTTTKGTPPSAFQFLTQLL